jgi:hypothetical protein
MSTPAYSRPVAPDPGVKWTGWLRVMPTGEWKQICTGNDYGGTLGELLALTAGRGKHVEVECLRQGQHPTDRPRGMVSARLRR